MPRRAVSTVHVIDDDDAVRESLEALLVVSGYAVECYTSAEEYLIRSDAADGCVLLDIHMPGISGLDLLHAFAQRDRRLPVLVLTASREERLKERALELGVLAVLSKPVPKPALLDAVRAAQSGPHAAPS